MKKILIFLASFFVPFLVQAFSVSPMTANIVPWGGKSQAIFKVKNASEKPLLIQSDSFLLSFDETGQEINSETDDLFILPLIATVPPHAYQTFVIKYVGEPDIKSSKSYRIAFETADVDSEYSGVKMQYRFLTLLNVTPKSSIADVSQTRTYKKDGKWFLELENDGTKFASLYNMKWEVGTGENKYVLGKSELKKHFKFNMLLPNDVQSYEFTPLDGVPPEKMKAQISNWQ